MYRNVHSFGVHIHTYINTCIYIYVRIHAAYRWDKFGNYIHMLYLASQAIYTGPFTYIHTHIHTYMSLGMYLGCLRYPVHSSKHRTNPFLYTWIYTQSVASRFTPIPLHVDLHPFGCIWILKPSSLHVDWHQCFYTLIDTCIFCNNPRPFSDMFIKNTRTPLRLCLVFWECRPLLSTLPKPRV